MVKKKGIMHMTREGPPYQEITRGKNKQEQVTRVQNQSFRNHQKIKEAGGGQAQVRSGPGAFKRGRANTKGRSEGKKKKK